MAADWELGTAILAELEQSPGQSLQELADSLGAFEPDIARIIRGPLNGKVQSDASGLWYARTGGNIQAQNIETRPSNDISAAKSS